MLIDFCERNGLIVTNTWFKKSKRRLHTWKALGDWSRHQLDYILVKHRDTQRIQNTGIEDSQGNRIVDQRQVLKIWENYVTELNDRPNRPETLEVEPEEEVDTD